MWTAAVIDDHKRGFLIKNGRFEALLEPGRHTRFDPFGHCRIMVFDLTDPMTVVPEVENLRKSNPDLYNRHFVHVTTADSMIAIIRLDDKLHSVVPPGVSRHYWKDRGRIEVQMVDVSTSPSIDLVTLPLLQAVAPGGIISAQRIAAYEVGLLFVNGEYRQLLQPGHHAYWSYSGAVDIQIWDMRERVLEVTAQEMLTKDRVSLRLTLSAFWKVIDPVKAAVAIANVEDRLYRLVQFAIRGAVAARSLDELLNSREAMDAELRAVVRAAVREDELGVQIDTVQVKDVILPGDMRDILNRVVEAEKQAQANLIRRREETAATRSLLNTARLMENNPLLLRLKELESLEKLTEKIGRIDFHAGPGDGLNGLMTSLLSLKPPSDDKSPED